MPSIGPLYPNVAASGTGPVPWTNVNNIKLADGANATAAYFLDGDNPSPTNTISGKDFGFAIPLTATITGIYVEVVLSSFARSFDSSSYLLKAGNQVGANRSSGNGVMKTTFGGPSDLWGTTWTPAEINNSNFGFVTRYSHTSNPSDSNVNMDAMRIVVYYEEVSTNVYDPSIRKEHYAKVYRDGRYLGLIPNVIDDLNFSDEINTSGSQTTIACAISGDSSFQSSTSPLLAEDGSELLAEDGSTLFTESSNIIYSVGANNSLITNGNSVIIYEISPYAVNGFPIFRGTIEKWNEDLESSKLTISLNSDGADLDNSPLVGPPYAYTSDVSQTASNTSGYIKSDGDKSTAYERFGQSFTVGSGKTNLGALYLSLFKANTDNVLVNIMIYSDSAFTNVLGSISKTVNVTGSATEYIFPLNPSIKVTAGTVYYFGVSVAAGQDVNIRYSTANPYSGGAMYQASFSGGSGGGSYSVVTGSDLYFKTAQANGVTTVTYPSQDPVTGMFVNAMGEYRNQGGKLNYSLADIQAAGYSIPYSFTGATMLDAIKKFKELAPANWYWYVDKGTNLITFKQSSVTADFKLIKGRHITDLNVTPTIEYVKNIIYFSGGKIGEDTTDPSSPKDINLYKVFTDAMSVSRYGKRIAYISDNRVTQTTTANALGSSALIEQKDEKFIASVTVLDTKMNISLLKPGKTIGFGGFGNYKDNLILQIMRRNYSSNSVNLELGILPQRQSEQVEQLTRDLLAEQTIDNPIAPS